MFGHKTTHCPKGPQQGVRYSPIPASTPPYACSSPICESPAFKWRHQTIDLTFLDATDQPRQYTLTREDRPGESVTFGNLPPMQTTLDWGWYDTDRYNLGTQRIGYIKFSVWMMPIATQFEQAMVGLKDADGIVIDLRGNPGGIAGPSIDW